MHFLMLPFLSSSRTHQKNVLLSTLAKSDSEIYYKSLNISEQSNPNASENACVISACVTYIELTSYPAFEKPSAMVPKSSFILATRFFIIVPNYPFVQYISSLQFQTILQQKEIIYTHCSYSIFIMLYLNNVFHYNNFLERIIHIKQ